MKIKGNTTVSRCIVGTSILLDTVKNSSVRYKDVMDNSGCQAHSEVTDQNADGHTVYRTFTVIQMQLDTLCNLPLL